MAVERIIIRVDADGTERVVKRIKSVGDESRSAAASVHYLQSALIALGSASLIQKITSQLDTYQNLQNRLKQVTKSTDELAFATKELFDVANRSRGEFETTVELFSRISLASRNLGTSNAQTARVTETLNKAVSLSGATTREANLALIQLTQGLASGALKGDEMRSVLEQIPGVADILAKKLGVTRGALRQLGSEGKVTAQVIIEALLEAGDEIDAKFAKSIPTIGQQFQVLQNIILKTFGDLNAKYNIIPKITSAIKLLGDNIETLARVAIVGALVAALVKVLQVWNALVFAIYSNPFGALAALILAATAALVVFSDQIKVAADSQVTLKDYGMALWESLKDGVKGFGEVFEKELNFLGDVFKQIFGSEFPLTFRDFGNVAAKVLDNFYGTIVGTVDAIKQVFKKLPATIELIFVNMINGIIGQLESFINSFVKGINLLVDNELGRKAGISPLGLVGLDRVGLSADAQKQGTNIANAFVEGFKSVGTPAADLLKQLDQRSEEIARKRLQREADDAKRVQEQLNAGKTAFGQALTPEAGVKDQKALALDEITQKLNDEAEALKYVGAERSANLQLLKLEAGLRKKGITLSEEEQKALLTQLESNQQLKLRSQLMEEVEGRITTNSQAQAILNDLIKEGGANTAQYAEKLRQLRIEALMQNRDVASGFKAGFLQIGSEITDFASLSAQTVTNAFHGMEDSLVEFVKTGKFSFSSLVDSILADLTRLVARQAIAGLIGSLGGGAGGIFGMVAGGLAGAKASGGGVTAGNAYLVGENGPEIFQPPTSGQIIPNGQAMGGPAPQVNVSVVNVSDPAEVDAHLATSRGQESIINVIRKNPRVIKQVLGLS